MLDICKVYAYTLAVIKTFRSKALEAFFTTGDVRKLPVRNVSRLRRILLALASASKPEDMNLPGFKFHGLDGDRVGTYSVWITGNWRVTFQWEGADVLNADIEDYH